MFILSYCLELRRVSYLLPVERGVLGFLLVAGVQVVVVSLESGQLYLEVLSLLLT